MTDPVEQRLAELPKPDVDALTAERIRRRARTELLAQLERPAWARRLGELWSRRLEPALVAAVVLLYAAWALSTAGELVSAGAQEPQASAALVLPGN